MSGLKRKADQFSRWAARQGEYTNFYLRIVIGLIFVTAGYSKVTGLDGLAGFLTTLGVPFPSLVAPLHGFTELVGGLMIITGLWVRPAVLPLILIISLAITLAGKWNFYHFLIIGGLLTLLVDGAKKFSLQNVLFKK